MIFLQALPVAIGERKKRLARYTPVYCKWPKVDLLSEGEEAVFSPSVRANMPCEFDQARHRDLDAEIPVQ